MAVAGCSDSHENAAPSSASKRATVIAMSDVNNLKELNLDGTAVADHPAPRLSLGYRVAPDGRTVAWIDATHPDGPVLGTLDLDSGATTQTPTTASTMDWLPDGRMVALDLSNPPGSIGILDTTGHFEPTGRLQQPAGAVHTISDTELLVSERLEVSKSSTVPGGRPVIVSLDGSVRRPLDPPQGCVASGMSPAPAGTKIAIGAICTNDTDNGLYLVSTTDHGSAQLVKGGVLSVAWSPDGNSIAYLASDRTVDALGTDANPGAFTATKIWIADATTGKAHPLTPDGEIYLTPAWRRTPD